MPGYIALVTGGCGCVGYHVVKALLSDDSFSQVHVFSRDPTRNTLPNVEYHAGSISSTKDVASVLDIVKPTVIFHIASPVSSGNTASQQLFYDVNVEGTKTLLKYAINSNVVKAFVYTSSSSVVLGPHHRTTEESTLITADNNPEPFNHYTLTKALADDAVLKANSVSGIRTCCLRITVIYGDRDAQMIPGLLMQLRDKKTTTQIGRNNQPMDVLSANNAAQAHLLAAKALLRDFSNNGLKVDGEAFFITDDRPVFFWDFARKVWKMAGDQTPLNEVKVIPGWLIIGIAVALEWMYWIFTLGTRTPEFMRSHTMRFVTEERTFNCEKAKERLGYKPVDDRDESIQAGVEYCLQKKDN